MGLYRANRSETGKALALSKCMIARWVGISDKKKTEGTMGFGVEIPAWLKNAPITSSANDAPIERNPWTSHTRRGYKSASSMIAFWIMFWAAVTGFLLLPSENQDSAEIARIIAQ